jgi:hypothetical protein
MRWPGQINPKARTLADPEPRVQNRRGTFRCIEPSGEFPIGNWLMTTCRCVTEMIR